MSLKQQQISFMAHILSDEVSPPSAWGEHQRLGLDVYRGNYRASLMDTLKETYPRTLSWVGEEAFTAAAAHHLITRPPHGWTLDDAGTGFDETAAELFRDDPEVAELIWTEWAMCSAFTAADAEPISAEQFARQTENFDDVEWARLRLSFLPSLRVKRIHHDIAGIWQHAQAAGAGSPCSKLEQPSAMIVWREATRSTFITANAHEAYALQSMRCGASYDDVCSYLLEQMTQEQALHFAGQMLGGWLSKGWVVAVFQS